MDTSSGAQFDWMSAKLECDVVMKGGITSGVVYPRAITEFAKTYRFRGVGGASAGAIGAALAAAAEFGRDTGGFDRLERVPDLLGDGKLGRLFQAQPSTKTLMPVLLSATSQGSGGPIGRMLRIISAVLRQFPGASLLGLAWGIGVVALGVLLGVWAGQSGGAAGIAAALVVVISGVLLAVIGWVVAVGSRLVATLTHAVPENLYGSCRGLSTGEEDGLTDWLSARIDELAGLSPASAPLTFGQLWGHADSAAAERDSSLRRIDLLTVTTCLSRTRPYEMPWAARNFFFSPDVWATLFPAYVLDALEKNSAAPPHRLTPQEAKEWMWATERAEAQGLRRLPAPADLPVIVATRMSLSFPLLISAVPIIALNLRSDNTQSALADYRADRASDADLEFETLWFSDGGIASNFPLEMFDSPLPTRPTFGINLGSFPGGVTPSPDQTKNIDWARSNRDGLLPEHRAMASTGIAAVVDFAGATFATARNWQDNSYLDVPGYRDRIVKVLQSKVEGGLNLDMDAATITGLAERGRTAASVMVDQFNSPHYAHDATGWQNQRWVRYRALLAGMPRFLLGYAAGRRALAPLDAATTADPANPPVNLAAPPSYPLDRAARRLSDSISTQLVASALSVQSAKGDAVPDLENLARAGKIRRVPRI